MKYCSNCGEQIDEKAVICVKCGVPVSNNSISGMQNYSQSNRVQTHGHGAATASLVLGIIGLIISIITLIVSIVFFIGYSAYRYDYIYNYDPLENAGKIVLAIGLTILPGLLSLIGLPLGIFCKKGGPKIAGIVLNSIAIVFCFLQVVLIVIA